MGLPVRTADRLGHDGADRGHLSRGFLWWGVMARHDGGMQLTPLRVPKILAFLKAGGSQAHSRSSGGGVADAQTVSPHFSSILSIK